MLEKLKSKIKNFKLTPENICKCVLYVILAAYAFLLIFGKLLFSPVNMFWRSINFFGSSAEYYVVLRILSYIIFFLGASFIIRLALRLIAKPLKKGKAIVDLTCSLVKYAAMLFLLFFVLKTVGIDTNAILAGIGIIGLVVGLGAQPLISDIIAGLFIVFEKVFDVGDIIVVDGFRGTVKEIGIRTTKIIDAGGNIKIMNNSDLKSIVNMTNQLSLAICDIGIEYGESLERVEAILKENMEEIRKSIPAVKEGPYYKGVAELANSAVVLRFVANCEEGDKYQVERDMNRQFKLLFDRNNINIPFPQVVVNQPSKYEDATSHQKEKAGKFVKEQKELSKGIADGDINNI